MTKADATKLPLTGGTLSGALAMGSNKITGLSDPSSAQDAATKTYVDTQVSSGTNQWTASSGNVYRSTGNVGIGITSPTTPLHVFKGYTVASGSEEYGQYTYTQFSAASTNWKAGIRANTSPTLTTGTLSKVVGVQSLISSGASGGTTTDAIALWGRVDTSTGQTITNSYGVMLEDGGGTSNPVNLYGLYVRNLTKGTAQNFAVYTEGTTKSYFGGSVGIGTASPTADLHLSKSGQVPIIRAEGFYNSSAAPGVTGRKARGTEASPLPVLADDYLFNMGGSGYGATGFPSQSRALIALKSSENWTDLAQGTYISFENTTSGGISRTEKMRISDSGNIGIGTATPSSKLTLNGGNFTIENDANVSLGLIYKPSDPSAAFSNTANERQFQWMTSGMSGGDTSFGYKWAWRNSDGSSRLDVMKFQKDGHIYFPYPGVHIGETAGLIPTESLAVNNAAGYGVRIGPSANNGSSALYVQSNAATQTSAIIRGFAGQTATVFAVQDSAGSSQLNVSSNGNVGIGTTAPTTKLQVAGEISPAADNTYPLGDSSLRYTYVYAANGTIQTSDARLKKEIKDTDLGLDFINKLRPVSYYWNSGPDKDQHYGLIAQETEDVLAKANKRSADKTVPIVDHDAKNDRYGIKYTELISPLIKAIQELYTEVKAVVARVMRLETDSAEKGRAIASLRTEKDAQVKKLEEENALLKARLDKIEKLLEKKK